MKPLHNHTFPNESEAYRSARNTLLEAEIALRRQTEKVAQMRRSLPLGGRLKEDYVFAEKNDTNVSISDLFAPGKDTLVVYNMMFDLDWTEPCPMCNSIVDGLNGNARQITQKINLVVIGKAPIEKLRDYAKKTGWTHLRILSSSDNSFNKDYFSERDGDQMPMLNVFVKRKDGVYHTWGSEMQLIPADEGQNERAIDTIWPLWNVLDLTPEGREDWYPKIEHRSASASDEKSSCGCTDCQCKK